MTQHEHIDRNRHGLDQQLGQGKVGCTLHDEQGCRSESDTAKEQHGSEPPLGEGEQPGRKHRRDDDRRLQG